MDIYLCWNCIVKNSSSADRLFLLRAFYLCLHTKHSYVSFFNLLTKRISLFYCLQACFERLSLSISTFNLNFIHSRLTTLAWRSWRPQPQRHQQRSASPTAQSPGSRAASPSTACPQISSTFRRRRRRRRLPPRLNCQQRRLHRRRQLPGWAASKLGWAAWDLALGRW